MTTYVAEAYLSRSRAGELAAVVDRVRAAAGEIAAQGTVVRYVRSTFVPEDETCFHVFEAGSADVVTDVSARAGIEQVRVVEAIRQEAGPAT